MLYESILSSLIVTHILAGLAGVVVGYFIKKFTK